MCGIVGVASAVPIFEREFLARGSSALTHRGPDSHGEWWSEDGRIGFAHRRLAVIDLSPLGAQPMSDVRSQLWITYNGELYNYRPLRAELIALGHSFRTDTDTEVILNAYAQWQGDCLKRLEGMYAFALFDSRREQVLLARDRAGEKPLFLMHRGSQLRFASELKGLLVDRSIPWAIEPGSLDCLLSFGFVPAERCILQGVQKLPPAHAATYDLRSGQLRRWRYWAPRPAPEAAAAASDATLELELEGLLQNAVDRQLVADVPVGILLSGGVDSSLITAMAARSGRRIKTFTVRFPENEQFDESAHSRKIARYFATDHTELDATVPGVESLAHLAWHYDEPIFDSSMIPTAAISALVRQYCTVALGGDGGDELFGGYWHYGRLLRLARLVGWCPRPLRHCASELAAAALPLGFKGRNWIQAAGESFERGVPLIATYFDPGHRRQLMASRPGWRLVAESIRAARVRPLGDLLDRSSQLDFENYLPEDILVKVDRASMASSLEVRAPLLDVAILDFAFGRVPARLKASATERKILLKKVAARVLPPDFDWQRKQGFSIPLADWLRGASWLGFFRQVLLADGDSLFDRRALEGLLESPGRRDANAERLFGLVMFELWRRKYGLSLGEDSLCQPLEVATP